MPDTPAFQPKEESDLLSLESILNVLRRRWFSIACCAVVGAAAGFYIAARQGYSFEKIARVILRDDKQKNTTTSDLLLSEFGLSPGGVNIANESYVVKSTDLMSRVVSKLRLNVSYWKKKDIRTLDLYTSTPLTVNFPEIDENTHCELFIIPLDDTRYSLRYRYLSSPETADRDFSAPVEGVFHSPLHLPFSTVSVHPTPFLKPEALNVPIIVRRTSVRKAAEMFLNKLEVTRPDAKEASLIEMRIRTSHPEKSADILNCLIAEYGHQTIGDKKAVADKAEAFLTNRLNILSKELDEEDRKILDFRTNNKFVMDPATSMGINYTTQVEAGREEFNINTQLKQLSLLHSMLTSLQANHTMLPVNLGIEDQNVSRQIEQYNEVYLKYSKWKESAGVRNPLVTSLIDNMQDMRKTLQISIVNYENTLKLRLKDLKQKQRDINENLTSTATLETHLTPMLRARKVKEELYLMLLGKREENALAIATTESGARVLEYAFGEDVPSTPKLPLFIVAGGAGGASLCLFAFLLVASLDTKVKTEKDLSLANLPVLAELPLLTRRKRKKIPLFLQEDRSSMVERLHILCNNVDSMLPRFRKKAPVILVTSTTPGEGKTFIAANLASSFSQAGKNVLLIDGELRKSTLTHQLGGYGRKGLTTLLLDQESRAENIIRRLEHPGRGMDVLYAGDFVPNPVRLLSTPLLEQLLNELKQQYDAIIVDAPPYGILADTAIMASLSDITLYVVRSGWIDKRYFSQVQQLAANGRLPNLAFLVNGVNFRHACYNRYGSRYLYTYERENAGGGTE